jgi:DNA uptake protein ComE-like DNA-binding protein
MERMKIGTIAALAIALGIAAGGARIVPQQPARHLVPSPEQRLDINDATVEELLRIPGMTKTWAGRIVRYRPYRTKQDLLDRGIVSPKIYARIKDYVIAHRERAR